MRAPFRPIAILILLLAVFLSPYYLTILPKFFIFDTPVVLYHQARLPLWPIWPFFSPEVYFYWRPIPMYLLAVGYHLFGLNPAPYHVLDMTLHGVNALLLYAVLQRLCREPWIVWGGLIAFLVNWQYCEIVFWIANLPTLLVTSAILLMVLAFLRFSETGRTRWAAVVLGCCAMGMLSKETIVSAPFSLLVAWWWRGDAKRAIAALRHRESWRILVGRPDVKSGLLLAVVAVLLGLYTIIHTSVVTFLHPLFTPYPYSPVHQWPVNLWMALNHLMLPMTDHIMLRETWVNSVLLQLRYRIPVAPAVIIVWMILKRDRWIVLGLALILAGLIPVFMIPHYNLSRYYYTPSIGMGIVWARIAWAAWTAVGQLRRPALKSMMRIGWGLVVAIFLLLNYSQTYLTCEMVTAESQYARRFYEFLRVNQAGIPANALIVIKDPSIDTFWGWRELAKFALEDDGAEAVFEHQRFPEAYHTLLNSRPRTRVYVEPAADDFRFAAPPASSPGP